MNEEEKKELQPFAKSFLHWTREELRDVTKCFFRIGFRLAEARRERYYEALGYENIESLAEAEFEIKRSTTYDLMAVWERYHDDQNPMAIKEGFKDFSSSQLLEMTKARYCGIERRINPRDTVRAIRGYVRYCNKYADDNSHFPDESLQEWLAREEERQRQIAESEQLSLPGEVVQTSGQNYLTEKDFALVDKVINLGKRSEPEIKEETFDELTERAREQAHAAGIPFYEGEMDENFNPYVYDGNMSVEDYELMHRLMEEGKKAEEEQQTETVQTSGLPSNDEVTVIKGNEGREEEKKYDFSTRAGVREFLNDCLHWKEKECSSPFISCHYYMLKNKRRIYVYVQRTASKNNIDGIYEVIHRFFIDLNQYSDVPVEITKEQFERYCSLNKDKL